MFRRATPADAPVLVQNNIDMALESENVTLPLETVRRGVDEVFRDPSKGTYYVIEVEGKVVAQLMITFEWSEWRAKQMWWIQSVFVDKGHRRCGYFRRLYDCVKEESRQAGAGGLRLYADNENKKAQDTYQSLGMTTHYAVWEDLFTDY